MDYTGNSISGHFQPEIGIPDKIFLLEALHKICQPIHVLIWFVTSNNNKKLCSPDNKDIHLFEKKSIFTALMTLMTHFGKRCNLSNLFNNKCKILES